MLEALNKKTDAGPEELLRQVREDVDAFVGNAEQFDDLTMLCFRYISGFPQAFVPRRQREAI